MKFTRTFHLNIYRLNFGVNVVSILFCDIILSSGRAKASIAVNKKIKSVKACADTKFVGWMAPNMKRDKNWLLTSTWSYLFENVKNNCFSFVPLGMITNLLYVAIIFLHKMLPLKLYGFLGKPYSNKQRFIFLQNFRKICNCSTQRPWFLGCLALNISKMNRMNHNNWVIFDTIFLRNKARVVKLIHKRIRFYFYQNRVKPPQEGTSEYYFWQKTKCVTTEQQLQVKVKYSIITYRSLGTNSLGIVIPALFLITCMKFNSASSKSTIAVKYTI